MKGKYKAAIALLLLLILLPLTLLMTLAQWVPTLAGIWFPVGKPQTDPSRAGDPQSALSG